MALLKLETKLKALAQLALQFDNYNPEKAVGVAPTDEELTSLYENQLDATRRAQIFSHIANNTTVHERWIRCVETLSFMDAMEQKSSSTVTDKTGLKISSFFSNLFNTKTVLGGGFATAAVVIIMVSVIPPQNSFDVQLSLNGAYNQWGGLLETEWQSLPASQKPTKQFSDDRSFFTKPKDKSQIQQVLETGYKKGISQIGAIPFRDFGINTATLSDIPNSEVSNLMTSEQYNTLVETGHLAAFATIQCRLDSSSERLDVFSKALNELRPQLANIQFNDTRKLVLVMESKNKSAVCLTAQYVVELITK